MNASGKSPRSDESMESSDHSLLRRLKGGSSDAATALYMRYAGRLNALARSKSSPELARQVDAEEIVQSVFGSFFRGAQKGCYDVPVGEELWKLFLVIALNKIRGKGAFYNAKKRDNRLTQGSDALDQQSEVNDSDDAIALSVLKMSIEESLYSMPPHYREMVDLRVEGHEIEEIARRTNRSKRTVERILQDIRTRLSAVVFDE